MSTVFDSLRQFWFFTGFANCTWQNLAMILIGIVFITIAIKKGWEPLLLVPIGFGMIIGFLYLLEIMNILKNILVMLKIGIYVRVFYKKFLMRLD